MASASDNQHKHDKDFPPKQREHVTRSPAGHLENIVKSPRHTSTPKKGRPDMHGIYHKPKIVLGSPEASPVRRAFTPTKSSALDQARVTKDGYLHSSPSPKSKERYDLNNSTVTNQRHELDLLISELRDRDQELNDMVAAHQKQLMAWDEDRQRILTLEQKAGRLEVDLQWKTGQLQSLAACLREVESQDHSKSTALETTHQQLVAVSEQQNSANIRARDLEKKNNNLVHSLREATSKKGQLEAKEKEFLLLLKSKDNELSEAAGHMAELTARLNAIDRQHKKCIEVENLLKNEVEDWKAKYTRSREEVEQCQTTLNNYQQKEKYQCQQMEGMKAEVQQLRRDLSLANERDQRKQELIKLQKSKMERTDIELNNLRMLYERQQRDLSLLHLNLESTKELLTKQQYSFSHEEQSANTGNTLSSSFLENYVSQSPANKNKNASISDARNLNSNFCLHQVSWKSPENALIGTDKPFCGSVLPNRTVPLQLSPKLDSYNSSQSKSYSPSGNRLRCETNNLDDSLHELRLSSSGERCTSLTPNEILQKDLSENSVMSNGIQTGLGDNSVTSEPDTPTSKLHRLLVESREMVRNLERSTFITDQQDSSSQKETLEYEGNLQITHTVL